MLAPKAAKRRRRGTLLARLAEVLRAVGARRERREFHGTAGVQSWIERGQFADDVHFRLTFAHHVAGPSAGLDGIGPVAKGHASFIERVDKVCVSSGVGGGGGVGRGGLRRAAPAEG